MKLVPFLFLLTIIILALSCAKQTSPSGGPRDTIPPVLVNTTPPNKTINFSENTITLTFDEYITLNNPQQQLLITPSIGRDYEMTLKKKTAILKLTSKLEDSTTYTINFRESVQDITEKNPAENLKYVFSTGNYLDSLLIQGEVIDALTKQKMDDAAVALYISDTFNIFDDKPSYLTKTNKEGLFKIENLKPGQYYLYAFADKNKNIIVDSKSEAYGFLKTPIAANPDSTFVEIPTFTLDSRELKLISAKPYNTYFNIKTSKSLVDYSIDLISSGDSSKIKHTIGSDKASVKVYLTQPEDSIAIQFSTFDSVGFKIDTTLYAKLSERQTTPEKFNLTIDKPYITASTKLLSTEIKYDKPIGFINHDSILYKMDSTTTIQVNPGHIQVLPGRIKLALPIEQQIIDSLNTATTSRQRSPKINKLIFGKGAIISIENDSSARKEDAVTLLTPESTGTILVSVHVKYENFIVQLLKKDYTIYEAVENKNEIVFSNILPGDYRIRVIHDVNENHQWDPGNFYERREPEPVTFYANEEGNQVVTVKANWELGPLLITRQQDVDNE